MEKARDHAAKTPKRSEYLAAKIQQYVESGKLRDGRLPTVRQLVKAYRTSSVTVVEALRLLQQRGVVEQRNRRREYVVAGTAEPDLSSLVAGRQSDAHEELADRLKADIFSRSVLDDRMLLSQKELCAHYGCHPRTLWAALTQLCRQGIIERTGRRYRVRYAVASRRASSRTYFASNPRVIQAYQYNIVSCVNAIERQLERMDWGDLQFMLAFDPAEADGFDRHRAAGIIYTAYHPTHQWYDFLSSLHMVPVAIIDPSHGAEPSLVRGRRRLLHLIADQAGAGARVAAALASKGHRSIAFVSHMEPSGAWVAARMEGVQRVYATESSSYRLRIVAVPAKRPRPPAIAELSHTVTELGNRARELSDILPGSVGDEYLVGGFNLVSAAEIAHGMQETFKALLEHRDVTAWVCVNDELASAALHFLSRAGVRVPQDISLVGFDNAPLAARLGISTYDFCYDRMGNLAVQWLANPSSLSRKMRKTMLVEGAVLMRPSLGPARAS